VDIVSGWVTLQRESDGRVFVFGSKTRSCSWDDVPYMIHVSWLAFLRDLHRLREANPGQEMAGVLYTNCWFGTERDRDWVTETVGTNNVLVFEAVDDLDNLMACLKDRAVIP